MIMSSAKKVRSLPPDALQAVERWCTQTILESEQEHLRLITKPASNAIAIDVAHIPGDPQEGTDWIVQPFAKLRYDPTAGPNHHAWSLYSAEADGTWEAYGDDAPLTGTLQVLLDEIEADTFGVFQWIDFVG